MIKKAISLLFIATLLVAQDKKKYEPTHEQHLELENAQLRAQLAQTQAAKAQENFNTQVKLLQEICKLVIKENKWPDSVECDLDKLTFAEKPTTPKEEKKK